MRLILASASPRRAELLAAAGYAFDVISVVVDERVRPGERPNDYVRRLAQEKSAAGLAAITGHDRPGPAAEDFVVLGADTAVIVDDGILGKPAGVAEAGAMLRTLSGRRHEVVTGVSLRWGTGSDPAITPAEVGFVATTAVFFAELGDEEIDWYVQSGEGFDKAGGYAIQGLASRFVERIEGSYSNVVGLPVAGLRQIFQRTPSSK